MKIIFLDIDGVLNNKDTYTTSRERKISAAQELEGLSFEDIIERFMIEPHLVEHLNKIVEQTRAKIVVSSTWRKGRSIEQLQSALEYHGFKGEVISKTPTLETYRGTEIQKWLDENAELNVINFIIIDDDSDMLHLSDKLVQCRFVDGLTHREVESSIEALNND